MTLVLTGASGFLGNNLNKFLVKKNYRVVRLNLRYFNKINKINIFNKLNRIKNLSAIINCAASLNPKSSSDFEVNENLPEIFQNYSILQWKHLLVFSLNNNCYYFLQSE